MYILGISALYHDAAACLIKDGEIVAAAQQERFSRVKHDLSFPIDAVEYCLSQAGIDAKALDIIAYYDNPIVTLDRYMKNILCAGSDSKEVIERGFDSLFGKKLWIHKLIAQNIFKADHAPCRIIICDHHISHGASAFYPSPFEKALILTMDGVGEWATTTIAMGEKNDIKILKEIRYPHSLGLLYSAFTYYCGFKVNSGDYKFMGLAPYGEPIYVDLLKKHIIDIKEDGSYRLNLEYFDYQYGRAMINSKLEELFRIKRREPESLITKHQMDIAASVQQVTEEVMLKIIKHMKTAYGSESDNLVLAGGVALNCVANGKILKSGLFKNMWIQPAAGDAGGALGCALQAYYQYSGCERVVDPYDSQKGSYLGNSYTNAEIKEYLTSHNYPFHEKNEEDLYNTIAELLNKENVLGLFHGRMEFGPRALGNRSIIADARSEQMQVKLNQKIKFRESFRPFAPSVLEEDLEAYFDINTASPYMLLVGNVNEDRCKSVDVKSELEKHNGDMLEIVKQARSDIPAVTHVDYSARIQTVSERTNPYYANILKAFKQLTGSSVIVNTSFNVRGEPIVCTPQNAYECFMRTDMDILVLENCILYKSEQPEWAESVDWRQQYTLD